MEPNKTTITLIAGIQKKDSGIGFKNKLLFMIEADLQRFKSLTTGHPIIMGRKTFESIGRTLPNRTNIVVTRQQLTIEGTIVCSSLEEAIEKAKEIDKGIFIIGGAEIYELSLPFVDRLELTLIEGDIQADTFFPDYSEFTKVINQEKYIDKKSGLSYEWVTLERPSLQ